MNLTNDFDESKTINDFIQHTLETIKLNESIHLQNARLTIKKIDENQVTKCKLVIYTKKTQNQE